MFKVKYVDSIVMLVGRDLNLIVSLFQHKCEVSSFNNYCHPKPEICGKYYLK